MSQCSGVPVFRCSSVQVTGGEPEKHTRGDREIHKGRGKEKHTKGGGEIHNGRREGETPKGGGEMHKRVGTKKHTKSASEGGDVLWDATYRGGAHIKMKINQGNI